MNAATEAFAQLMGIAGKTPDAAVRILEEARGMQTRFQAEAAAAAALAAMLAMAPLIADMAPTPGTNPPPTTSLPHTVAFVDSPGVLGDLPDRWYNGRRAPRGAFCMRRATAVPPVSNDPRVAAGWP